MTDRIGSRALRAELATHLRRAGAGHRLIVTAGGRDVAALGPLDAGASSSGSLDALVAAGAVVPPRRRTAPRRIEPVPVWTGIRLDRALRDVRG